jgi:DivIVA domain-containing protein
VASQGQRFRRKALRRGYKVDEVDAFLDRVEATLAGGPVGSPVASQEVHDVVFRVRFGGYDEWQVDLHLDRVERQIAELEERGGRARGPEARMAERFGATDRMGPPHPMGPPNRPGPPMGPPMRDERGMPAGVPPMPPRPMPAQAGPAGEPYGRYDQSAGAFRGGYEGARPGYEGSRPGYESAPTQGRPTAAGGSGPAGAPGWQGGFGGPDDRFERLEPGRHGKADMTAEIRMPDRDPRGPGTGPGLGAPPLGGRPTPGPPTGAPMGRPGGDLQRIDQIRRSFQVRRWGSGYDPAQVDRLFDGILAAMSGRGPMPVNQNELTVLRFGLVPGGYYEEEVDAALREVQDILRRF